MSHAGSGEGSRRGRALAWATLIAAIALGAAAPINSSAVTPAVPLPECATTVAPDELSEEQAAIGFTVRRGEQVEPFDVTVLGLLKDGVAPGRDLVIIKASGPVIDEGGGGISAGMSGSPVYTLDGRLIGAVAFGFTAGPSPIGGVTPAEPDMVAVLREGAAAPASPASSGPEEVTLEPAVRRRIARSAGTSTATVGEQMSQLDVPLAVSGALLPRRRGMLQRAAEERGLPFIVTRGASARASAGAGGGGTLAPGDAFATAASYGDVTVAGIGTATYVCDGQALAFGHPFLFGGPTLLGASRARIITVVSDPTFGPFKLGAPTEPVGIVDRDRLAAVGARLGAEIPTIPVTQDTAALDTGRIRRNALTEIVRATGAAQGFLPDIAFVHAFTNIDSTFDQISGGSAFVSWTIRGTKGTSGEHWALTRSNPWTSDFDISIEAALELLSTLLVLQGQDLEPIQFQDIDIDVSVEHTVREYEIAKVLWSKNGRRFADVERLRARPGDTITARVRLRASDDRSLRTVQMRFRVPRNRRSGLIEISGGGAGSDFEEDLFCALFDECESSGQASTFDRLLAKLQAAPRNDDLIGRASFGRSRRKIVRRQDRVVKGFDLLRVIVGRRPPAEPRPE